MTPDVDEETRRSETLPREAGASALVEDAECQEHPQCTEKSHLSILAADEDGARVKEVEATAHHVVL